MILALLIAAAAAPVRAEPVETRLSVQRESRPSTSSERTGKGSAVEAERAFAADAKAIGQWAAFRKWAHPDAILFWPEPVNALEALAPLKEPARAVEWSPARSFVSCDGGTAANTGPTRWPDGRTGYFSTIWSRQPSGEWRWTLDHGDAPAPTRGVLGGPAVERRASCAGKPISPPALQFRCAPRAGGKGGSADGTLAWFWHIPCGGGSRSLQVWLWTGAGWNEAVSDHVVTG